MHIARRSLESARSATLSQLALGRPRAPRTARSGLWEVGLYDISPTYGLHQNGLKFGFSGSTGAIISLEFGKTIKLGADGLTGHYKLGAYYDTSTVPDIAYPTTSLTGRYGGYLLIDQMVMRFQPGTDRGLSVVLNGSISDSRTAPMPGYLTAALIAQSHSVHAPRTW